MVINYEYATDLIFESEMSLVSGYSKSLVKGILPPNTTVTFVPEDPTIVTVNSAGLVSGTKVGFTTITVTLTNNADGSTKSHTVEVGVFPSNSTIGINSGSSYYIQNVLSGKYVEVYNGGTSVGTRYVQSNITGRSTQKIKIAYVGMGEYVFSPVRISGKVIGINNSFQVTIQNDLSTAEQRWYILSRSGGFLIVNKANPLKCMSVSSQALNTNIVLTNETAGSLWTLGGENINVSDDMYAAGVRVTNISNAYYYDYTMPIDAFMEKQVDSCHAKRCISIEQIRVKYEDESPDMQFLYWLENLGLSAIWFFQRVKTGGEWDIKNENSWNSAFPNVPYLGVTQSFAYNGELKSSEDMGNVMYGYLGRAVGFGSITLYWGGGLAKHNLDKDHPDLKKSPLYGDDENDHVQITYGYDMYPDRHKKGISKYYTSIGYDGIPTEDRLIDCIVGALQGILHDE